MSPLTPRRALAIRHVHFEDCGSLAQVLREHDIGVSYLDVARHSLRDVDLGDADLVVYLGGPVAVYEDDRYPWIRDELALLDRCLALEKPVIGFCLGAQMLARALGARVYPGPVKELGWKPLTLTAEGRKSVVAPLGQEGVSMLHWHGDTFDLPEEATLLASTAEVPHQIFECGYRAIGFQCHPEILAEDFESWLIGHACEIGVTPGASVDRLRADTARHAPALTEAARLMFSRWLIAAGLPPAANQ